MKTGKGITEMKAMSTQKPKPQENNLKPGCRRQEKSKSLYMRSDFATLIG